MAEPSKCKVNIMHNNIVLIVFVAKSKTGLEELRDGMMKCLTSTPHLLMNGSQGRQQTVLITYTFIWFCSKEAVIGHYTQFVWGETYQVGCGILISEVCIGSISRYTTINLLQKKKYKFHYLVCNYYPSGNVVNDPVYIRGEPCSACPEGTICKDGLCAKDSL